MVSFLCLTVLELHHHVPWFISIFLHYAWHSKGSLNLESHALHFWEIFLVYFLIISFPQFFLPVWNFIFWMINVPGLIYFLHSISLSFCHPSRGIKSVLLSQVNSSALFSILPIESLISVIIFLISRNSLLSLGYSFYTASCSYFKEALYHCSMNASNSLFLSFHVFIQ